MQNPEEYSFLLLAFESTVDSVDLEKQPFTRGDITQDVFSILEKLDTAFRPHLGDVQRSLACKECLEIGTPGYFEVQEGARREPF